MEKHKKILIVDDDENIIQTLKMRLEANGYKIFTASNGVEGLEQAKEVGPDLILLNIMMPQLDGIMTTLKLKGIGRTKSIPVIIMTGIKEKEEMVLARHVGAADYITKPFEHDELLKKISKLLP
ncbi:MAG: response regulator [Candidatus Omnitrophota bacterium]|nr:response regulator [Candidatus Omnitrophota bacterium]